MDAARKKLNIFDILLFISILFIGTDVWAISVGVNIRFIQLFYVVVFIYLVLSNKYKIYFSVPLLVFLASAGISTFVSINFTNSFMYFIWIIYDVIILLPIFYYYVNEYGPHRLFVLFRMVFLVIFVLIIFQFIIDSFFGIELPIFRCQHYKGITRPALWFYEPSYLASFLLIYFSILTYKIFVHRNYKLLIEYACMALSLIMVTSTTGFIGIAICILFGAIAFVVTCKTLEQKIISSLVFLFGGIILIVAVCVLFPGVVDVFVMRLFRDGITSSSGTRVSDYQYQIDCFLKYPIFGAGLDCYGIFRGDSTIEATNISLELLACSGIVGFVAFYWVVLYPVYKVFFSKERKTYNYAKIYTFSLLVLVIILQANQNYMRLYLWMMIAISYASIIYEKRKAINLRD